MAIGPIRMAVLPPWTEVLDESYRRFLVPGSEADAELTGGPLGGEAVTLPVVGGGALAVRREGRTFRAVGPPDGVHLRTALRWTTSELLRPLGGLLLHGAALASHGQVDVFLGPSGAGKTTLARNARGTVLAEETVVVWPHGGRWVAGGTPWFSEGGFPGDPGRAAIRRLGLLEQSRDNAWRPEAASRLFPGLAAQVYSAEGTLDRERAAGLLDLLASVEVGRLCFTRYYTHAF